MQRQQAPTQAGQGEPLPGIIDTIGLGFSLLLRRPYLIWPPILLDLFLWQGPRIIPGTVVERVERWLTPRLDSDDAMLRLISGLQDFNLFRLLAIITPSLVQDLGGRAIAGIDGGSTEAGLSWVWLILVGLTILVLGAVAGTAYLTMVGYLIKSKPVTPRPFVGEAWLNFLRTVGLALAVIGIFLLLLAPLLVFSMALLVLGVNVLALVSLLMSMGIAWLFFMLFFAQHAIIVSGVGPFRAIYLSYNVVRAFFWPSIGFIFAFMAIRLGMPVALQLFTSSPWSVPFALIAHAYIATGITAAGMLFYRDRARRLIGSPSDSSLATRPAS